MNNEDGPPYRDGQNKWRTESLFWDIWTTRSPEYRVGTPVFSLYRDRPGLINARTTFVEVGDMTGYRWAIKYLGDWEHWEALIKRSWFKKALETWRAELAVKLQSEALDVIQRIAQTEGHRSALPAARYLHELEKQSRGRGRPTQLAIDTELKREVERRSVEDDDASRIGLLKVIDGGKT